MKWLAGDPWRLHGSVLGLRIDYEHVPPFEIRMASDLSLPHVWDIAAAFMAPAQRNGPPLGQILFDAAVFTFREALVGFVVGAALGLGLAIACSSIRGCWSGRSCPTSWRRRPCRSSRSRRSS